MSPAALGSMILETILSFNLLARRALLNKIVA